MNCLTIIEIFECQTPNQLRRKLVDDIKGSGYRTKIMVKKTDD